MPELPQINFDVIGTTFTVFLIALGSIWAVSKALTLLKH